MLLELLLLLPLLLLVLAPLLSILLVLSAMPFEYTDFWIILWPLTAEDVIDGCPFPTIDVMPETEVVFPSFPLKAPKIGRLLAFPCWREATLKIGLLMFDLRILLVADRKIGLSVSFLTGIRGISMVRSLATPSNKGEKGRERERRRAVEAG